MLDVIGLGRPDGTLCAHAVPHVAGAVIVRALVSAGIDAILFDRSAVASGMSPLTRDEVVDEGVRLYPDWPDIDYDVLLSPYATWQLMPVVSALSLDGDFRRLWADETGHPASWLDGTDGIAAMASAIRDSMTPEAVGEAMLP